MNGTSWLVNVLLWQFSLGWDGLPPARVQNHCCQQELLNKGTWVPWSPKHRFKWTLYWSLLLLCFKMADLTAQKKLQGLLTPSMEAEHIWSPPFLLSSFSNPKNYHLGFWAPVSSQQKWHLPCRNSCRSTCWKGNTLDLQHPSTVNARNWDSLLWAMKGILLKHQSVFL